MENRAYALITGLFILVLGSAVVGGVLWLGSSAEALSPYVVVSDDSVSGLVEHSTVMYRGVHVGQVSSIGFDPSDFKHILIQIQVDSDVPITEGTYAVLRPQGVSGFSRIELTDDGKHPKQLQTSDSNPASIPMHPSLLAKVTTSGADLIAQGSHLLKNLNALLNDENGTHVKSILTNVESATRQLVELEKALQPVLAQVPVLTQQSQVTLKRMNKLLQQVGALATHIDGLTRAARQLGTVGASAGEQLNGTILPQVSNLLTSLNRAVDELQRLTTRLNEHPESLLRGTPQPPPGPGEPGYQAPR